MTLMKNDVTVVLALWPPVRQRRGRFAGVSVAVRFVDG